MPVLAEGRRNEAKRFILLIDTLYDQHARLVAQRRGAAPSELYAGRAGGTEAFEFDRTASRLIEMQGRDWLDGHGRIARQNASLPKPADNAGV